MDVEYSFSFVCILRESSTKESVHAVLTIITANVRTHRNELVITIHCNLFIYLYNVDCCQKSNRRYDPDKQESSEPATVTLDSLTDKNSVDPVDSSHGNFHDSNLPVKDSPPPYHLVCDSKISDIECVCT